MFTCAGLAAKWRHSHSISDEGNRRQVLVDHRVGVSGGKRRAHRLINLLRRLPLNPIDMKRGRNEIGERRVEAMALYNC